ncbi:MAG: hypothetical protein H6838_17855 [Planctomycetes bacterium]|nr:hypothetical protein [Planctomycetota bacterium]
MTDLDPTEDAVARHRRRVRIALWIANAIVVNELAAFGLGALRLPAPALEHYGRLVLVSVPAILHYAVRPGRPVTALSVLGVALKTPLVILGNVIAGGACAAFAVAVMAVIAQANAQSIALGTLVGLLLLTTLWLVPARQTLQRLPWLAPAVAAFVCVVYVPPHVVTRTADGQHLVEAGLLSMPSNPVYRVCRATTLVPGALQWWYVLGFLPSDALEVSLHREGDDVVVKYERSLERAPQSLRVR